LGPVASAKITAASWNLSVVLIIKVC
jgi:hypothetical protein